MIEIKNVDNLRSTIIKNGYNFAEFADKLGISRSSLNKIFTRKTIAPRIAKKICIILDVEWEFFFAIRVYKSTRKGSA